MKKHLKKFNIGVSDEIIEELDLPKESLKEMKKYDTDISLINFFIQSEMFEQAIKYIALGLPLKEAIWWAYICAQDAEEKKSHLNTQSALRTVNQWIRTPSEELRQSNKNFAETLQQYTPTSWAAMAIFWSGGSIAPVGRPPIEPLPFMAGHAVSNAITLAASEAESYIDKVKHYIKQGLHIAMGGNGRI